MNTKRFPVSSLTFKNYEGIIWAPRQKVQKKYEETKVQTHPQQHSMLKCPQRKKRGIKTLNSAKLSFKYNSQTF